MIQLLHAMKPSREYLICVDSDGCVFDNMELKHKECFCPATINCWELQSVSRYAREAAEFVNLYSKTRGINRFPGLVRTLELLAKHPGAIERGWVLPDLTALTAWIEATPSLSAAELRKYAQSNKPSPALEQALRWSNEVDANVAHIVRGKLDFPPVYSAMEKMKAYADIVIVSATPHEAIEREWQAHGLDKFVTVIAGQEMGTKSACIAAAVQGCYAPENVLMVGDAPGDYVAAANNKACFYPIVAGNETESWNRLSSEALDVFLSGAYKGAYEKKRLSEFDSALLENPSWLR